MTTNTHVHVTNKGERTHSLPGTNGGALKPGLNTVKRSDWEHAKTHAVIAHHVTDKTFVESEIHEKKAPEKKAEPEKKPTEPEKK